MSLDPIEQEEIEEQRRAEEQRRVEEQQAQKELEIRHLVERSRRIRNVAIVVPACFGSVILLALPLLDERYIELGLGIRRDLLVFVALGLLAISVFSALMSYLQTGFKRNSDEELFALKLRSNREVLRPWSINSINSIYEYSNHSIHSDAEIKKLRAEIEAFKNQSYGLDEAQKDSLIETVKAKIRAEAGDSLISDLQNKAADAFVRSTHELDIKRTFEETRSRLSLEIAALGRRGNLNLSLGVLTTVTGLFLLAKFVFTPTESPLEALPFALHFVPRLTLVVFIEVFAYFFLRLYKSSLAEIKYFQNELTNVEQKNAALITAIHCGESSVIHEVISKFAATERNHVLEKGQTTVELEKSRLDKESLSDVTKHLGDLLKSGRKP